MNKLITLIIIFTLLLGNFNTISVQAVANTDEQVTSEMDVLEQESEEQEIEETTYYSPWSRDFPAVNSDAAIVMNAETGSILYGKNIHDTYYPASITKILTTLIALENSSMNETVTFSRDAVFNVDLDSSRIGIDVAEELTMEESLYGIMLSSANEVSYAVAEHVGGDFDTFIKMMNDKAKSLGATNSNFVNPHGLPDPSHYTTTYDMALISRAAIQNDAFKDITKTRTYIIPPTNIQEETRYLSNHHKFVLNTDKFDGAIGGKTGWTTLSKYTLVTFAERNGMTLISVVMHCPSITDEYGDTASLLDYAFDNFNLYNMDNANITVHNDMDFFTKYHSFFNTSNSPLRVNEDGKIVLPNTLNISDAKRNIDLIPLENLTEGDNLIGSIIYSYDGVDLGKTNIVFNNTDSYSLSSNLYIDPASIISESVSETEKSKSVIFTNAEFPYIPVIIGALIGLIVIVSAIALIYYFRSNKRGRRRKNNRFY